MADDFLSGLLGNNTQQDFASPLQVAIAKALMEKAAPEQMKYDPTIPGGWKASVVNALGNINSAMYRNQALRVNQGIIGNNARTATNLVVRPQDNQPAIKPSVVMKEQGDIKPTVNPTSTIKPIENSDTSIESDDKSNLGMKSEVQPEVKAIVWKNLSDQGKKQVGSVENVSSQDVVDFLSNHILNGTTKNAAAGIGVPSNLGNLVFDQDTARKMARRAAFDDQGKLPGRAQLVFDQAKTLNPSAAFPPDAGKQSLLDQSPAPHINNPGAPVTTNTDIPGETVIPKNVFPETTIPKNVFPSKTAGLMALGAGNAPGAPDPSQLTAQDRAATPWSVAQQQAQEALQKGDKLQGQVPQQIPKQEAPYLPDEQKELNTPTPLPPVRTAQNVPDRTGRPGIPQGQATGFNGIPGYNGPIPSIPSLPSEKAIADRIHALAIHGDMEGVNEFVQSIQKQMEPKVIKVPNGELHITPKHYPEPNQVQFFPSAETSGISAGGVSTQMGPQFNPEGQLEQRLRVPGPTSGQGAGGGMNSLEDFATEGQRIGAQGEATSKIYGEKAAQVSEAITQGQKANNAIQSLNTMDALSKSGGAWTPAGPTKDAMIKMRQVLDNVGFPTKGTPEGEIFDKFNTFLASESTKAITSRGTNFDLATFMQANPSLIQSKEGREALIDVLKQEYKARQYIGKRANQLGGKDVDKLSGIVEEYYRNNPIKFKIKVGKGEKTINTYPVQDEQDVEDHVKSGEYFYGPSRKERYKP